MKKIIECPMCGSKVEIDDEAWSNVCKVCGMEIPSAEQSDSSE